MSRRREDKRSRDRYLERERAREHERERERASFAMVATTLTAMAAVAVAVTATREIAAARYHTGATLMIAAGLGPRAFRQQDIATIDRSAVDHSHTGATTRDQRSFNSGFPVVALVSFHDSVGLGDNLSNAGTGFSNAAALRSSLYYHGKRRGKNKKGEKEEEEEEVWLRNMDSVVNGRISGPPPEALPSESRPSL